MLYFNMRWEEEETSKWNKFLSSAVNDFHRFLRTLTRILGSWLHAACVSSLVFIIWGWPCQMSIDLILRRNFLLENKHKRKHIKSHTYFPTCKHSQTVDSKKTIRTILPSQLCIADLVQQVLIQRQVFSVSINFLQGSITSTSP